MNRLILAIETSIKNGSLSLLNNTDEIDGWTGNDAISRSEDLLPQIKQILNRNNIHLNQLEAIAVSIGPGSFTGLRVGLATAKALALSAACRITGVSILEAMAQTFIREEEIAAIVSVVSAGRGLFFWQVFQNRDSVMLLSAPEMGNREQLEADMDSYQVSQVVFEQTAYDNYRQSDIEGKRETSVFQGNFATLIGLYSNLIESSGIEGAREVSPLYVRAALTKTSI